MVRLLNAKVAAVVVLDHLTVAGLYWHTGGKRQIKVNDSRFKQIHLSYRTLHSLVLLSYKALNLMFSTSFTSSPGFYKVNTQRKNLTSVIIQTTTKFVRFVDVQLQCLYYATTVHVYKIYAEHIDD